MIKYALQCGEGHEFEGWFSNCADYEKQEKHKLVACPYCSSADVSKMLMAPSVAPSKKGKDMVPVATVNPMQAQLVEKIRELKQEIEKNADNVGEKFPEEARKIHYGEAEARGIYGKASLEEAAELADEGIEFLPLPELPEESN